MKNLLIVDDDEDLSDLLAETFLAHYVNVYRCKDGACVFEKLKEISFDIIILDYNLPGMSGLEIAERLHKIGERPILIMITGYSDQIMRERARQLGVTAFLEKPFDVRVLDFYVTKCLEQAS